MEPLRIGSLVEPVLAEFGLELEAVEIQPVGRRSVLRIVVDGDGPEGRGPGVDEIAEAANAISAALDESDVTGAAPYTLEVSSRGVARPLTAPRHWRRNRGRLVKVVLADGGEITGRIAAVADDTVTLTVSGADRVLPYDQVTKALVQVEFNRPGAGGDDAGGDDTDQLSDSEDVDDIDEFDDEAGDDAETDQEEKN